MCWPGGLARVLRRRSIAGGQGRGSQRRSRPSPRQPAKLGGGLDGRVGGGSGRSRVTLVGQRDALAREANRPLDLIVSASASAASSANCAAAPARSP